MGLVNKLLRIPEPIGMCRWCGRPYFNSDTRWAQRGICLTCWDMADFTTSMILHRIDEEINHAVPVVAFALKDLRNYIEIVRNDPISEKLRLDDIEDKKNKEEYSDRLRAIEERVLSHNIKKEEP